MGNSFIYGQLAGSPKASQPKVGSLKQKAIECTDFGSSQNQCGQGAEMNRKGEILVENKGTKQQKIKKNKNKIRTTTTNKQNPSKQKAKPNTCFVEKLV